MSLFEDERYEFQDTFFVFFKKENRPAAKAIEQAINDLGSRFQLANITDVEQSFESAMVHAPHDRSAMDIIVIEGDEVTAQIQELLAEFRTMTLTGDDRDKLTGVEGCDARLDIFHFGQKSGAEDDFLDPGGLLLVLGKLAGLCDGIALDPQSQVLL
jgi:hypothetical protein